jgi:hypothetical protein
VIGYIDNWLTWSDGKRVLPPLKLLQTATPIKIVHAGHFPSEQMLLIDASLDDEFFAHPFEGIRRPDDLHARVDDVVEAIQCDGHSCPYGT